MNITADVVKHVKSQMLFFNLFAQITLTFVVSLSGYSYIQAAGVYLEAKVTLAQNPVQTTVNIFSFPSCSLSLWPH